MTNSFSEISKWRIQFDLWPQTTKCRSCCFCPGARGSAFIKADLSKKTTFKLNYIKKNSPIVYTFLLQCWCIAPVPRYCLLHNIRDQGCLSNLTWSSDFIHYWTSNPDKTQQLKLFNIEVKLNQVCCSLIDARWWPPHKTVRRASDILARPTTGTVRGPRRVRSK